LPIKSEIGIIRRDGIESVNIARVNPLEDINEPITGDITVLPMPLLAFIIPEIVEADFRGSFGVIVPMIIPYEVAPVPAGSMKPRHNIRGGMDLQNGIESTPTIVNKMPDTSTNTFPFFAAIMPNAG
jgi:hypothetical protein